MTVVFINKFFSSFLVSALLFSGEISIAKNIEFTCGNDGSILTLPGARKVNNETELPTDPSSICNLFQECAQRTEPYWNLSTNVLQTLKTVAINLEGELRLQKNIQNMQRYLETCRTSLAFTRTKAEEKISLHYALLGPNKIKNGQYDQNTLTSIVKYALQEGADPYLALAIVTMENSPLSTNVKKIGAYAQKLGTIPVNQVAALNILGCKEKTSIVSPEIITAYKDISARLNQTSLSKSPEKHQKMLKEYEKLQDLIRKKYAKNEKMYLSVRAELNCATTKHCSAIVGQQRSIPTLDLQLNAPMKNPQVRLFCDTKEDIKVDGHAVFSERAKNDPQGCCVKAVIGSSDPKFINHEILSWAGATFLRNKLHACAKNEGSISSCFQQFNGTGCFGCTEKVDNSCLNGMVMEDRPIYGSRTADLMLNVFMQNPKIQQIVEENAQLLHKPIKSSFCLRLGKGTHRIAENAFLEEQKRFLLTGPKNTYKARYVVASGKAKKAVLKIPSTPEELAIYQRKEANRARVCAPLFQPTAQNAL